MNAYSFNLIPEQGRTPTADVAQLAHRPILGHKRTLEDDAAKFVAGPALSDAINTAIAVGEPLLLTGQPGTGKTQTAYYVAFQLGVQCIHFQVKSDSSAKDLLYHFDMVRYFRDAHLNNGNSNNGAASLDKEDYIEKRALWTAFEEGKRQQVPQVLLIDEIDKAPRDFPNDLLHELNQMEFTILETSQTISAPMALRPLVFITSNSERRLPEPFLRRCVYHHIEFNDEIVRKAVESRRDEFQNLNDDFLEMAIKRFLTLRDMSLRKMPADQCVAGVVAASLAMAGRHSAQTGLEEELSKLPFLGTLLKDHQDIEELKRGI